MHKHKHPHSVLEHCVCLLLSLVVHHHLTKVILIDIIFVSHILQWTTLNNKIDNNFSLGSRISMVHQKCHPVIHPIPIGDEPRVMIPYTYLILASRTQILQFGQHVIFPCPKVSFRNRLPQHQKKGSGPRFQHLDTFHICVWSKYTNNTWNICHIGGVVQWGTIE